MLHLKKKASSPFKLLISLVLILSFLYAMYWLWQRQPKQYNVQEVPTESTREAKTQQAPDFTPPNNSVLTDKKVKFQGSFPESSFVAIFSDDFQKVAKTNPQGNFETEASLSEGLNLIRVVTFTQDLQIQQERNLKYYLADKDPGNNFFAGIVKTILESAITLSTDEAGISVRTNKSTQIKLPNLDEDEATRSPIENIRVGDYLIAAGDIPNEKDKDSIIAKYIEVLRDEKPKLSESVLNGKTASAVKNNVFSVKSNTDDNSTEFVLTKDSTILVEDKDATAKEVTKDKNVLVFYYQKDGKNIVDLLYLIP